MKLIATLEGWCPNQQRKVTGKAILAMTPDEAKEKIDALSNADEIILVCPEVDWSWSFVTKRVDGVVAFHGTRVSRGAELTGLLQIPASLGVGIDAKRIIKEGMIITIVCDNNQAIAQIFEGSS